MKKDKSDFEKQTEGKQICIKGFWDYLMKKNSLHTIFTFALFLHYIYEP